MPKLPIGRRAMTVALSSLLLMAATLIPFAGITAAAGATCPSVEGTYCYLRIDAPSSVRTSPTGTSQYPFTVQVAVTTSAARTTVANADPCGSKALITLTVSGNEFGEGGYGTFTATANAGIATFTLSLHAAGPHTLTANGPNGPCNNTFYSYASDTQDLMAVDIPADAPIAPCPVDTDCVQATSNHGTQATLIAEKDGTTWKPKGVDYFRGVTFMCGTPPADDNGVLGFTLTIPTNATKTGVIILALNRDLVKGPTQTGTGQYNVCWGQTATFTTASGAQSVPQAGFQTGDLPNCKGKGDQTAPCVLSRTSGQHNVVFVTILTGSNDPDPLGYAH